MMLLRISGQWTGLMCGSSEGCGALCLSVCLCRCTVVG